MLTHFKNDMSSNTCTNSSKQTSSLMTNIPYKPHHRQSWISQHQCRNHQQGSETARKRSSKPTATSADLYYCWTNGILCMYTCTNQRMCTTAVNANTLPRTHERSNTLPYVLKSFPSKNIVPMCPTQKQKCKRDQDDKTELAKFNDK